VPVRTSVERGEPVSTILRPGTLMNLTVLGAHHGPLVTDLLRGSVVSPVVQQAPSPVAVVPEIPPPGTRSTS
jgi:nucleotide-binding universal stress UspA family protein